MKKSIWKRYGKRALAVLMTAAMILPSNFGVSLTKNLTATAEADEVTVLTDDTVNSLYSQYFGSYTEYNRVSVHDPSIVVGYKQADGTITGDSSEDGNKVYYIFGSHLSWAYSDDLENWTSFTNNLNTSYTTIFQKEFAWSSQGDSVYGPSGNMWAPDITWDADYVNSDGTTGAWLMYMSINGCSWNSSIALLTAKSLDGDWTHQNTVVYSGFTNSDSIYKVSDTDYADVTGYSTLPARYTTNAYTCTDGTTKCTATTWNQYYGAHAIDPCVIQDGDDMWMTYGSWSGGIWMFKLDKTTGLRDTSTKYTYEANVSDEYMGYKLAGGTGKSGEASYIQKIGEKYYLFLSYGGLTSTGGYNMRVFSSDTITGPYKDVAGNDARYGTGTSGYTSGTYSTGAGTVDGTVGNRLMAYYKWSFMDSGFVAEGHNSAFVDTDGKAYLIYHTRFDDGGGRT